MLCWQNEMWYSSCDHSTGYPPSSSVSANYQPLVVVLLTLLTPLAKLDAPARRERRAWATWGEVLAWTRATDETIRANTEENFILSRK